MKLYRLVQNPITTMNPWYANESNFNYESLYYSLGYVSFTGEKNNGKISTIEVDNKRVKIDYSKYEEIISRISDILDRYLLLEKLGIEKVYEY